MTDEEIEAYIKSILKDHARYCGGYIRRECEEEIVYKLLELVKHAARQIPNNAF